MLELLNRNGMKLKMVARSRDENLSASAWEALVLLRLEDGGNGGEEGRGIFMTCHHQFLLHHKANF